MRVMEDIITKTKTKIQPIFARHETFHPRFGWLKKGFDKAIENSACHVKWLKAERNDYRSLSIDASFRPKASATPLKVT
jgi:hypothetical protein